MEWTEQRTMSGDIAIFTMILHRKGQAGLCIMTVVNFTISPTAVFIHKLTWFPEQGPLSKSEHGFISVMMCKYNLPFETSHYMKY